MIMDNRKPVTRAVQAGLCTDDQHRAVMPPIVLSSNFTFERCGKAGTYDYTRSGNPTRDLLAESIADLEGGATGVVTSSGMSAVAVALQLVPQGARVIAPHDCYGGTFRLLNALRDRGVFSVDFVDLTDDAALESVFRQPVGLVWIETPSNPLLRLTDLRRVSGLAHAVGAVVVADNTFLTPVLQRPIEWGADVVVHSTTKYLNGHSDVVGGAVVAKTKSVGEELAWWANCLGVTGAPFDSYLTMRGIRTLHTRMAAHLQNAEVVVAALEDAPGISKIYYPGLESHPGHDIATRQQDGYGAMLSFELESGDLVDDFVGALKIFTLAESLGGVESLICHPATMTHASMTSEARRAAGISDALLRISVGIESAEDLAADLIGAAHGAASFALHSC
jgi:cystathionine gamma-synthase